MKHVNKAGHVVNGHHRRTKANNNSKTQILGVSKRPSGYFSACIEFAKKRYYLGQWKYAKVAHNHYLKARELLVTAEYELFEALYMA